MKRVILVLSCLVLLAGAAQDTGVRVWTGSLSIPTYTEGPPNPNAPFDLFSFGRFNYPYPIRDALTNRRETETWRTLNLENEYLRLTVLPDLGGHVYSCLDKRSGREMFYANPSIKKALIGYRGAWAAFGIEFNFPVSHNWMSLSPVDFATERHEDGSGSIWVGNIDRVYGSQWRVELRLSPGRSVLEQKTELYNPTSVRHRYYWWNNAAVQVWDDSHLVYPTQVMATHGFTRLEPWPVDQRGRDLSIIRNQADGPVSLFTYGTREGFVGVYHPHTNSGTVHVADPAEIPVHKVWSWGHDRDAEAWSEALSDDHSAYVELQAGLFRNQETYAFLEPQEAVRFSEYWLPVRDLGGITRANADAVLHMQRDAAGGMRLALDVTRALPGGHLRILQGSKPLLDSKASLSPREVWRTELTALTPEAVEFTLADATGATVLQHTESLFDLIPASSVHLGPQPDLRPPATTRASVDQILELGSVDELEGRRLQAMSRYSAALGAHPGSFPLLKAAGRLAVALGLPEAQRGHPPAPVSWLEAAHARDTTDFEVEYYLGVAHAATGEDREARPHLEAARRFRATRAPATLELARLSARQGDLEGALALAREGAETPRAWQAGAIEVSLLRRLGRQADARRRGDYWRSVDPTNSVLRVETWLAGGDDAALWDHLGADGERVLEVVDEYLALGAYADALKVIERACLPPPEPRTLEPGAVPPDKSPLVAYYRGYLRARLGGNAESDYAQARALPTTYVFPSRHSSYAVFDAALAANPGDATARFLLGSLYLSAGLVQPAIGVWQSARHLQPPIPTLHRNLALALLYGPADFREARAVLEEGITADRANVELYLTLDGVLSAEGAPPRERVAALRRFQPGNGSSEIPVPIVLKLAQALAEAGEAKEAERLFHGRFFPREEGGTSIRTVYAQVRLASAYAAANQRDCVQAFDTLDGLLREREGLGFTAGGLAAVIDSPPMALQAVKIEAACDRPSMMRPRLVRLARARDTDAPPLTLAIADEARRRLGRPRTAAERRRLATALDAVTRTLDSGTTSNPGMTEYTRALLLEALGRRQESRHALRRVFIFPDRNLSHALARNMMVSR